MRPPLPAPAVRAWQTGLARPDRLQHAGLSFALAAGGGVCSGEPGAAFAGTLVLGLVKEARDARRGGFDGSDLAAGAAGALLGAAVARALRR